MSVPGRAPSLTPPGPKSSASTSGVSDTHITTTSLAAATSLGVPTSEAPDPTRSLARPGVRFQTVSANPARSRLAAMALPMVPSPQNPMRSPATPKW
jgi:hypothetical protein